MLKVYSKKTISTILASSLVFGLGTAVVNAAPNTTNSVSTGRTDLKVATGVITADKIPTLAHGDTDVTLTGTVVIDGPQLVLTVGGNPVDATLTKVADKTWTYSYKTTVGDQTDDVTFNIGAYTVYTNGTHAGQTHTSATSVGQTVHVPFVKSYDYTNLNWKDYDRTNNIFTFSYNLIKVWDDGVKEAVTDPVNASVSGNGTYQNLGFTITPPVVVQSFAATEGTFSNYDRTNNTYDLTFDLTKQLSNGKSETTTINESAVDASQDYVYNAASDSDELFPYSHDFTFTPPVTVRDFTASEGTFSNYNSTNNTYTLTFDLTKVLSKGDPETVQVTETVDAAGNYTYTAADDRAPGYSIDFSFTPPTVFRDFSFSTDAPVWTYNSTNNTYSVSFGVNETWSNGTISTETFTRDGLTPGIANDVSVTVNGGTHKTSLTAPAAPAPVIPPSVTGTVDASSIQSLWTGKNGDNVQEAYTLSYMINGIPYTKNLSNNFTKNGTGFNDQSLVYSATVNGQTVVVNYTLPYKAPTGSTNN